MKLNARLREYVGKSPGNCLLIAGALGLIIESAKNAIAGKLHGFAEAIGKKTADAQSGIVHTGKRASELLDHSAEYVRQFDYHQTDTDP